MNKNFLLSVCLLLGANFIFAQEVPEVQRPLVTKISATWCPPCGGWGWTLMEELVIDNEDKATLIVAHHDGQLVTASVLFHIVFIVFCQILFCCVLYIESETSYLLYRFSYHSVNLFQKHNEIDCSVSDNVVRTKQFYSGIEIA